MLHDLPHDASFWQFLFTVDRDLAEKAHEKACPCGGRLHRANYPRKPRGGPDNQLAPRGSIVQRMLRLKVVQQKVSTPLG